MGCLSSSRETETEGFIFVDGDGLTVCHESSDARCLKNSMDVVRDQMARHDILMRIKQAEADAKASVQQALQEKEKRIADATTEAANIVRTAESEAQAFYEKELAKAEGEVKAKKQSVISEGMRKVDALRSSANAKLDKAVEYLLKEFMGLLHA